MCKAAFLSQHGLTATCWPTDMLLCMLSHLVPCVSQVSYLLSGLFARACKSLGSAAAADSVDAILGEVRQLRGLLTAKLGQINSNLEGEWLLRGVGGLCVRGCGWLSASFSQASRRQTLCIPRYLTQRYSRQSPLARPLVACCDTLCCAAAHRWFPCCAGQPVVGSGGG
jgi:hypothetical protein